jgi:hypothetical protein
MSYAVTWSEGTKERLRTGLPNVKPPDRREWFLDRVTEHVEHEIAAYPQDASAQPGQRVSGELRVAGFCVGYEIHMDTHTAIITEVKL